MQAQFKKENLNPTNHYSYNVKSKSLQQKQIEDLEQKVDIILIHNEKLMYQNQQLKRIILEKSYDEHARKIIMSNDILIINLQRQLQYQINQTSILNQNALNDQEQFTKQLQQLTNTIKQLTINHQNIIKQKQTLIHQHRQLEQQIKNHKNLEIQQIKQDCINQIITKEAKWEQEKKKIIDSKKQYITQLQNNFQNQKRDIRTIFEESLKAQIVEHNKLIHQKTKEQRIKAEQYVRSVLEIPKQEIKIQTQNLKKQIQLLKLSLENRKKIISQLTSDKNEDLEISWYNRFMKLKEQMKMLSQNYLRQSELLKVKMGQQHQLDVNQVSKAYQNIIESMSVRISELQKSNCEIRAKFQQQLQSKLNMKHKFQIDISKLKNLIKKLKIDLENFGVQYRIQIQNIKTHTSQVSSNLLLDIQSRKIKDYVLQQELIKLRQFLDIKDKNMEAIQQKCDQRIKFYTQKFQHLKNKATQQAQKIQQKQKQLAEKLKIKQQQYQKKINNQNIKMNSQIQICQKQIEQLKQDKQKIESENKELKNQINEAKKDIKDQQQKIQMCNAHIQTLKLEMDIKSVDDSDQDLKTKVWKNYYQRKIAELQQDKILLQEKYSDKEEQLTKILSKYKDLENSLQKTVDSLKKRTKLQKMVIQIGTDNNLVKNLAQLFSS